MYTTLPGYYILGVPRSGGHSGSRVMVIYNDWLKASVFTVPLQMPSTFFELQLARLMVDNKCYLLVDIYRPPSTSINALIELADRFSVTESMNGYFVVLCDFSCPSNTPDTIDNRLSTLLSCYNMATINMGPTHTLSIERADLLIVSELYCHLSFTRTMQICLSDHLLSAVLHCARPRVSVITYSFRH